MSEKVSPVRKLIKSIESFWEAYADNLDSVAKGEEIKYVIEDRMVETVLKMTKEITSFEQLEKIANPELKLRELAVEQKPIENMFEHAVKKVSRNGNTKV